jgi:hypothetical protein
MLALEVFSPQFGQISSKFDFFSFEMMMLERVGARENSNKNLEISSKYFPQWIYEHLGGILSQWVLVKLRTS